MPVAGTGGEASSEQVEASSEQGEASSEEPGAATERGSGAGSAAPSESSTAPSESSAAPSEQGPGNEDPLKTEAREQRSPQKKKSAMSCRVICILASKGRRSEALCFDA